MSKKLLTIFSSLFLVGMLSISCSNADKTGSDDSSGTGGSTVDTSKGIEQYNGNTYVSSELTITGDKGYLWISIKDSKVAIESSQDATTAPEFPQSQYFSVTGTGTDYNFSLPDSKNTPDSVVGTLKFSSDASTLTLHITKNTDDPNGEISNKDIVFNKK